MAECLLRLVLGSTRKILAYGGDAGCWQLTISFAIPGTTFYF